MTARVQRRAPASRRVGVAVPQVSHGPPGWGFLRRRRTDGEVLLDDLVQAGGDGLLADGAVGDGPLERVGEVRAARPPFRACRLVSLSSPALLVRAAADGRIRGPRRRALSSRSTARRWGPDEGLVASVDGNDIGFTALGGRFVAPRRSFILFRSSIRGPPRPLGRNSIRATGAPSVSNNQRVPFHRAHHPATSSLPR